jgi:hypothetical protein
MRSQQSKRSRVPQTPRTASPCGHCGTLRTRVQLGELIAFTRKRPLPGLETFLARLLADNSAQTQVYVCGGCSCITTDPGPHRHRATRSAA